MSYNVSILQTAELDIREAFLDYNSKRDELGDAFEAEIKQEIEYLKQEAQTIQVRYANIRILFLKRFPFGIHFQLEGNDVLIVAVYAMKDDPAKWNR